MKRIVLLGLLVVGLVFVINTQAAEKIYFVHTDHLGTPQALTDDNQTVVWKVGEDPFGDATPATQTIVNNVRFPGQYYDSESGLHYNWNRYYDPKSGRYVTSDPIGLDGGLNTFGYVYGNPLYWIDEDGLNAGVLTAPKPIVLPGWLGPVGGVLGAGYGGYWVGGKLYPIVAGPLGDAIDYICKDGDDGDDDGCSKASGWQLAAAGITDAHDFKAEYVGKRHGARWDICACKDGSIKLKAQGQCGNPGPSIPTYASWK